VSALTSVHKAKGRMRDAVALYRREANVQATLQKEMDLAVRSAYPWSVRITRNGVATVPASARADSIHTKRACVPPLLRLFPHGRELKEAEPE